MEQICDGLDNNCSGSVPEDEKDNDFDGFVECTISIVGWQGSSNVEGGKDCNDEDPRIHPNADEECDDVDNDCDFDVDEDPVMGLSPIWTLMVMDMVLKRKPSCVTMNSDIQDNLVIAMIQIQISHQMRRDL